VNNMTLHWRIGQWHNRILAGWWSESLAL